MEEGLLLVLKSLAEYFNYFSITLIILCFALMTAFIIRLNGDHWGRYHNTVGEGGSSLAQQKNVTQFTNPFFLRLSPSAPVSSLSDGVSLEVSCLVPCELHVYWGAGIHPLHAALLKTGTHFVSELRQQILLGDDILTRNKYSVETAGKHHFHLPVPTEVSSHSLGPPPRQRYPCVIVMATTDSAYAMEYTSVAAMVTTLHVKDGQCGMETHIIAQYAKLAGQAVYNMQPLFFATVWDESSGGTGSEASHNASQVPEDQRQSQSADEDHHAHSTQSSPSERESPGSTVKEGSVEDRSTVWEGAVGDGCECRHRPSSEADDAQPATLKENCVSGACNDSDGGTDQASVPHQTEESERETALAECIVCQNRPLNYVLLPCRHACVCRMCFQRLDRCPMCRSHIESYFTLWNEDDLSTSVDDQPVSMDLYSRFQRFNDRLNALFGFE